MYVDLLKKVSTYQKTNMIMAFEAKVELMAFTCDKGHLLAIVYESVMYYLHVSVKQKLL